MWRTLQFVVTWPAGGAALLVNTAAARRGNMEIWKWNCPGSGKWRFVCCHEFYDLTHISYNSCWDVCIFCLSIYLSICPPPFANLIFTPASVSSWSWYRMMVVGTLPLLTYYLNSNFFPRKTQLQKNINYYLRCLLYFTVLYCSCLFLIFVHLLLLFLNPILNNSEVLVDFKYSFYLLLSKIFFS